MAFVSLWFYVTLLQGKLIISVTMKTNNKMIMITVTSTVMNTINAIIENIGKTDDNEHGKAIKTTTVKHIPTTTRVIITQPSIPHQPHVCLEGKRQSHQKGKMSTNSKEASKVMRQPPCAGCPCVKGRALPRAGTLQPRIFHGTVAFGRISFLWAVASW